AVEGRRLCARGIFRTAFGAGRMRRRLKGMKDAHKSSGMIGKETIMRRNSIVTAAFALAAMFLVSACSGQPLSTREKYTGGGALIGAATGAIIGAAVGAPGAGAAIGGALGGVTGFAVGNDMQNTEPA